MSPIQRLQAELASLPGVSHGLSRFGSRERLAWSIDGREFAHLHADDLLDLRLPRSIQRRLRNDPRAHFRRGSSEWLEFEFHTIEDVEQLGALAREAFAAAKAK